MRRFIEIMQDSAGVIEKENTEFTGIHTGDIQSCLVSVYACEKAHIMIHDSGQLKISCIVNLIKKYGNVKKVTLALGKMRDRKNHDRRLKTIFEEIGYRGEVSEFQSAAEIFSFQYPLSGNPEISDENSTPNYVENISDKYNRQAMIEINNLFLELNSEQLELDVQFSNGSYRRSMGIIHSSNYLLETVKEQPKFFFLNLAYLKKVHDLGLLEMPEKLLRAAKKIQELPRYIIMDKDMTLEDKECQSKEYANFINGEN